jgi:hypothetical protein
VVLFSFYEQSHVSNIMTSAANDSDTLPPAFNDLQVVELDPSSRECPYNALQWHSYPDGKHYACIAIESEAVFLAGESKRGQCTLIKHRDRPTYDLLKSVTYLCSHSKERKRQRKARQELGHVAAIQLVQSTKKRGTAAVSAGLLETSRTQHQELIAGEIRRTQACS